MGFRYNPRTETIEIRGRDLAATKKFRDAGETGRAAFVVDDVVPGDRWRARGVEVRGRAEVHAGGETGAVSDPGDDFIRLVPEHIVGWGIDSDARGPNARSVA